MTLVNCTIGNNFAAFSSDTRAVAPDGAGDRTSTKVWCLPHLGALVGLTGGYTQCLAAIEAMAVSWPGVSAATVLDTVPGICTDIARRYPGERFRVTVAAATPDRRIIAAAFDSEQDFAPTALAGTNAYAPEPNAEDPSYDDLAALSALAVAGAGVDHFHRELALNQWRAAEHARMAGVPDMVIPGGTLVLHRLDADGSMTIRRIMEFPAELPARPRGPARPLDPLAGAPATSAFFTELGRLVKPAEPGG